MSFFERQTEPLKRPADTGGGHRYAIGLFEEFAVLFEGEVRVGRQLGRQSLLKRRTLLGRRRRRRRRRRTRIRFGLHLLPGLAAALEPTFYVDATDTPKTPRRVLREAFPDRQRQVPSS